MHYQAIGFDYGGVIKGLPKSVFRARAQKLLGITEEEYQTIYERYRKDVNIGNGAWVDLWRHALEDIGQREKLDDIMALSKEVFERPVSHEMISLVDRLRRAGLKVGLLSNNNIAAAQQMRVMGVDEHFDVFHVSGETGSMKPQPEAFLQFAHELGAQIGRLIFIDDSRSSLSTAEYCGYTPILFTTYADLVAALAKLRVL